MEDPGTGLVTADLRKVCWKVYKYHGVWYRCRVACRPEPVVIVPSPPPPPPRFFAFEGNCDPLTNAQPYSYHLYHGGMLRSSIGGAWVCSTNVYNSGPVYSWYKRVYIPDYPNKYMNICYAMPFGMPSGSMPPAGNSISAFCLNNPRGKVIKMEISWQLTWNGAAWYTSWSGLTLYYASGRAYFPYRQVLYVKYDYNTVTNKTKIDYCGVDSDEVIGKVEADADFLLTVQGYPWASAIDYQRFIDLT